MNTENNYIKSLFILLFFGLFSLNINAQKIACGEAHSLAICKDSTVWAWGANNRGQLGDGTFDSSAVPIQVQGLSGVVAVGCGFDCSFAIKNDGTLWGWGDNTFYQLGLGSSMIKTQNTPIQIPNISNVRKIYSSGNNPGGGPLVGASVYAVTSDDSLWGWGLNSSWLFGDSGINYSAVSLKDTILHNVVSVGGGGEIGFSTAYLVLLEDGTIWGWGTNTSGQLGIGSAPPNHRGKYVQVKNLSNVKQLSSSRHSLAIREDGTLWAWAGNLYGQLGDSTNSNKFEPVQIKGIDNVKLVVASESNSYAIKEDNTLWAWGRNNKGQLGDGTTTDRNYPASVDGISNVVEVAGGGVWLGVSSGEGHSLAVTSDGKLWSWGYNNKGQLGDGTMIDKHSPFEVQGICEILVSVSKVSSNSTEYNIYPNPATNILHIDFTTVTPNKIEIQDIHGRTVYSQLVSPTQKTHEVSLADVSSGVYFVKLFSSEGVVLKKVIKE